MFDGSSLFRCVPIPSREHEQLRLHDVEDPILVVFHILSESELWCVIDVRTAS